MKKAIGNLKGPFRTIFNFRDDESKGRVIALSSALLTAFYNVFISGIFYTGFLSMYDMSITDIGILSFIPYIANVLSVFSPKILSRFPRRKPILLGSRVLYFLLNIVFTTLMPQFVRGSEARMVWFVVIKMAAAGMYALFSGGFTIWLYNFYPKDNNQRMQYVNLTQIFSQVLAGIILVFSGVLTDALANSPYQGQLILFFRYFAFALVLVEVVILSRAKEYPYQDAKDLRLVDVFTQPFRYKKFRVCLIAMFVWNYFSNLNAGLWDYHLLNHLHFSYTTLNTVSMLHMICLLILSPLWRRILRRFSWVKSWGISLLLFAIPEFMFFCMTQNSTYLYFPASILRFSMIVGINLASSNMFYMNLPAENATAHLAFYNIGCNLFAFLGLSTGTWLSSLTGDNTVYMFGMDMYSFQLTHLVRTLSFLAFGLCFVWKWRSFTSDEEIARVEQIQVLLPQRRKRIWARLRHAHLYRRSRTRQER